MGPMSNPERKDEEGEKEEMVANSRASLSTASGSGHGPPVRRGHKVRSGLNRSLTLAK